MTIPVHLTPGAERILEITKRLAAESGLSRAEPIHLLWALVLDESRGAEILAGSGVTADLLQQALPLQSAAEGSTLCEFDEIVWNDILQSVLLEARAEAALLGKWSEIGSEHLLWGLTTVASPIQEFLETQGFHPRVVKKCAEQHTGLSTEPLETQIQLSLPDAAAGDAVDTLRIIDASFNRAREGLRVVEDFVRFALNDRHLTEVLKTWRHELTATLSAISSESLLASRDTQADVGTSIQTRREGVRVSPRDVALTNMKRVQEALRTLEEFGKILAPELGKRLEALRYELYTIERGVFMTHAARDRLQNRQLYLLASSEICPNGSGPAIHAALAAGAGIIQVREKKMGDRELTTYGRLVREWTARAGALFIMNDRPDLALLTDADGVHIGQEELTVREARRILGPNRLVGVSTHSIEQARQAVLDGADYIGVGPVFATKTKSFSHLAGLDFVRQVATEITLPAFAIGGIDLDNLSDVLEAGARRIAVSGAICRAEDPGQATRDLLEKISQVALI
jgi:thiamine-phosphate pyrophosphorylase